MNISMKLVYKYMAIFFIFHPPQVTFIENCDSNSRLVVDEGDNGKFRLERVKQLGTVHAVCGTLIATTTIICFDLFRGFISVKYNSYLYCAYMMSYIHNWKAVTFTMGVSVPCRVNMLMILNSIYYDDLI